MYLFGKWFPLMAEEGEGGNGGGNEGGDEASRIAAAVEAAVGGLKTKNSELLGKLKAAGENAARFDGIDPDEARANKAASALAEEKALIAAGNSEEAEKKRIERIREGFAKETATERAGREAAEAKAEKFSRRVLENGIRAEAQAAGLHQYAIDDALLRAGSTFKLDDEGNPVAVEGAFGKDGNPITLKEWFAEMKDKAPHWFPATASGSGAGHGGGNGGNTMTQAAFDALSPKERAVRMAAGLRITG